MVASQRVCTSIRPQLAFRLVIDQVTDSTKKCMHACMHVCIERTNEGNEMKNKGEINNNSSRQENYVHGMI